MAVEHAAEPVHEARFAALRDPALRRTLAEMLARRGRTLIQRRDSWISGYDDAVTAPCRLAEGERAVLTLVLVHSVAIPRADGLLSEDTWLSPYPVAVEELRRRTLLPIGELESALRALRQAGLLTQVKAVSDEVSGGYVPGPQFHRLTTAARKRLQEELILAAGPHTPLASAIRSRRASRTARPGSPAGSTEPATASTTTETRTVETNVEGSA
jgi:DNA-binding transcriptional ArsR family regulator